jgi:hypothetical protein
VTARIALVLLAAAVAAGSLSSPADAGGDRTARRLRRAALAHYKGGDYAAAARDFRAAYEIEAEAELLYAIGQSLRLAGDCAGAIDAYQDFLITGPEEAQAGAAREKIEVCRQVLAPTPAAPAPPPAAAAPGRTATPLAAPLSPARRPTRSWVRDPVGGILLAGGVAAAGTGTWLWLDARDDGKDGEAAHGQSTAGAILIGAGGGMVAAAVIRYALVRRDGRERRDDQPPAVAASIDAGGGVLWITGRF